MIRRELRAASHWLVPRRVAAWLNRLPSKASDEGSLQDAAEDLPSERRLRGDEGAAGGEANHAGHRTEAPAWCGGVPQVRRLSGGGAGGGGGGGGRGGGGGGAALETVTDSILHGGRRSTYAASSTRTAGAAAPRLGSLAAATDARLVGAVRLSSLAAARGVQVRGGEGGTKAQGAFLLFAHHLITRWR